MSRKSTWTDAKRAHLASLYHAGAKDPFIARSLGVTENAVRVRRHKEGLVSRLMPRRTSIRGYTIDALLKELNRRVGPLPEGMWALRRKRELDPELAGGIHTF